MTPGEMLEALTVMRASFKASRKRDPRTVKELEGFLTSEGERLAGAPKPPEKRHVLRSLEWIGK